MKIKKILSGIIAGALALSTLAGMSFATSAEESTALKTWMSDASTKASAWWGDANKDPFTFGGDKDADGNPVAIPGDLSKAKSLEITLKSATDNINGSFGVGTGDDFTWASADWSINYDFDEEMWMLEDSDDPAITVASAEELPGEGNVYTVTYTDIPAILGATPSAGATAEFKVNGYNRVGEKKAWVETPVELLTLKVLDENGDPIIDLPVVEESSSEEVIWEGSEDLGSWNNDVEYGVNIVDAEEDGIVTVEYTAASDATYPQIQFIAKVGSAWTWTVMEVNGEDFVTVSKTGTSYKLKLTAEQAEIFATAKALFMKGQDVTITKVTYTSPASTTPDSSVVEPESSVVEPESSVVEPESSIVEDESSEIELPPVELDDPTNVKYQLADNASKVRFIWFVNEADVEAATGGSAKLTVFPDLDSDPIITTTPITTAYRSVYAAGTVVTAPAGKVIVISPITHSLTETSGVRCVFSLDSLSSTYCRTYEAF